MFQGSVLCLMFAPLFSHAIHTYIHDYDDEHFPVNYIFKLSPLKRFLKYFHSFRLCYHFTMNYVSLTCFFPNVSLAYDLIFFLYSVSYDLIFFITPSGIKDILFCETSFVFFQLFVIL